MKKLEMKPVVNTGDNPLVNQSKKYRNLKCKAHTVNGLPCRSWAMDGKEVCSRHGGKAGRPIDHGRYSKFLKGKALELYHGFLHDENMLSVKDEIARLRTWFSTLSRKEEQRNGLVYVDAIIKAVQAEAGKKYVITIEGVYNVIQQIVNIINLEVKDEGVKSRIASRLSEIKILDDEKVRTRSDRDKNNSNF